jgi:hypothetical protein
MFRRNLETVELISRVEKLIADLDSRRIISIEPTIPKFNVAPNIKKEINGTGK